VTVTLGHPWRVVALAVPLTFAACDDPAESVGSDAAADVQADAADDTLQDGDSALPPDGSTDTASDAALDAPTPFSTIRFGTVAPLSGTAGQGGFRFGAATAAAQIEDGLRDNDWYSWTAPEELGGLARGPFVADAVRGAERVLDDMQLVSDTNLDAYRFSVDWSRVEPVRDEISAAGLAHYSAQLDALVAAGVRPMVTLHHFSSPIWVDDFRDGLCRAADVPSDTDLCGWGHPAGGALVAEELAEFAGLIAAEFGDRVDEWCTLNEPVNYLIASYGAGVFPPGASTLIADFPAFLRTVRAYLSAHVAMYDAIRAADTIDADGDGVAAAIGLSLSVADWTPARGNAPSENPADIAAAERVNYIYHFLVPDALRTGVFDADVDGEGDTDLPDWRGKLDWLGVQYYFRAGVTGEFELIDAIDGMFCFGEYDFGSCLPPEDPTWWVPTMRYEFYAPGLLRVLEDLGRRYPDLPLVVTEAGIATRVGARRAENVVRVLEQIDAARELGIDVRGYYHWSLVDNFEWAEGWEPKFGLFSVDLDTWSRTPTEGATVLAGIAAARAIMPEVRERYGGNGPMTPELAED
jgi:beta-glucosidase